MEGGGAEDRKPRTVLSILTSAEQALIWDLGGAFHMKPSSRSQSYGWMLFEKRRASPFLRDKSTMSPKTVSGGESTFPKIYKKILSRDTRLFFGESFSSENALLLSFFFCYLFLDPPGG